MKNYIFLFAILTILLAGCDTEGDNIEHGYTVLETSFMPQELKDNYRVTFNGDESPYISKNTTTVKLEVFPKEGDVLSPILTEEKWLTTEPITFFQPVGKELAIYSEEEYQVFKPAIIFSNDESQYSVQFKGSAIKVGENNYIDKAELPGKLTIKNKVNGTELYSQELTVETPNTFTVMQLSENEFLPIEDSSEADPEAGSFKVRFLYTTDAFPNYPELKLVLYLASTDFSQFSPPIATITIKAGELSEYVVMDNNYFDTGKVAGVYDLINPNDGSYIVNNLTDFQTSLAYDTYNSTNFKFMTFRFTDPNNVEHDGVKATPIDALCTPW